MLRAFAKQLWDRWPYLKAVVLVLDDLHWKLKLAFGHLETDSGSTHAVMGPESSVRYVEEVVADYKRYGGVEYFGEVAAEVGPGDNACVAMLLRESGSRQVDLIDRYYSRRNSDKQRKIYDLLSSKYKLQWLKSKSDWDEHDLAGISLRIGRSAEEYFEECSKSQSPRYDTILSRSVLEHLYDPLHALESMVACLRPGGRLIHKIDLRDHGLFSPPHHELTFLTFHNSLYGWMSRNSGRPNRVLIQKYRECLAHMKAKSLIEYSLYVTRLVGVGDLTPHPLYEHVPHELFQKAGSVVEKYRRKLAKEFRDIDSRDLAVSGVFLVAVRR